MVGKPQPTDPFQQVSNRSAVSRSAVLVRAVILLVSVYALLVAAVLPAHTADDVADDSWAAVDPADVIHKSVQAFRDDVCRDSARNDEAVD